jgi:hypothetical protein
MKCCASKRHRFGAAAHRLNLVADPLQSSLQILTHRRIVFGQEDSCHNPSMLRQNAFFQKRIMRSCVAGSLSKS